MEAENIDRRKQVPFLLPLLASGLSLLIHVFHQLSKNISALPSLHVRSSGRS